MRILITTHAVDQYVSRVHPEMAPGEARRRLCVRSYRAAKLPERTPSGEEMWDIGDAVLVVGFDRDRPSDRICKTVIPPRTEGRPKLGAQLEAELRAALDGKT